MYNCDKYGKFFKQHLKDHMLKEEYYDMNYKVCKELQNKGE